MVLAMVNENRREVRSLSMDEQALIQNALVCYLAAIRQDIPVLAACGLTKMADAQAKACSEIENLLEVIA